MNGEGGVPAHARLIAYELGQQLEWARALAQNLKELPENDAQSEVEPDCGALATGCSFWLFWPESWHWKLGSGSSGGDPLGQEQGLKNQLLAECLLP